MLPSVEGIELMSLYEKRNSNVQGFTKSPMWALRVLIGKLMGYAILFANQL